MTEASQVRAQIRRYLSPYLRLVPFSEGQRVSHTGVADHYWIGKNGSLRGISGWIESKLIPASGKVPNHFTLEQLMWGEEEVAAGGRWHLLGLVTIPNKVLWGQRQFPAQGPCWVLYDAPRARQWFDGIVNDPLFSISGRFPTREILHELREV